MKKKKIIVFSLFIVCIVVAVIAATYFMGKNKEKADTVNEFGFESDFKCSTKKVDLESMNFKADKNGSYEESNESFAMTEDGIYYFVDEYLKFYDFSSKKKVTVCNKPNCKHDNKECNAYFETSVAEKGYMDTTTIIYYEGYLYMAGCDDDGKVYLYRISKDGSSREKYMQLYGANFTDVGRQGETEDFSRTWIVPNIVIRNGYVYYMFTSDDTCSGLMRKKLGSDKVEYVVKAKDDMHFQAYRFVSNGDYLLFQVGVYNEDYTNMDAALYALNDTTDEIVKLVDDFQGRYYMRDDCMYYLKYREGLYRYSFSDGKTKKILPAKYCSGEVVVNKNSILCFNVGELVKEYDLEGNLLKEHEKFGYLHCKNGDYIVASKKGKMEEGGSGYLLLDIDTYEAVEELD